MVNPADETKLIEAAKALQPRILAERERIEAARGLPEDLVRELAHAGFFRIYLPAPYGGLDLTPMAATKVFEELARADASVAWCVWNGNTYWTTVRWAKEVARAIFADPDTILANSTRPSGQATVVEGGYRVSGRWSLVSGCQFSAWLILMCIVHEDGKQRLTPSGGPEMRFMLCPAADCEIVDTWTVAGLRGTGSHDVVVQDRFVPAAYASFHTDPLVLTDPRYKLPHSSRISPGLGAMALGIARGAIEALIELAGGKRHERTNQALTQDRVRKLGCPRRRRWCVQRGFSCSIPSSGRGVTCSRDARPRSRPGRKAGWRLGMPSRAPARRWISYISLVERRRSTRLVRSSVLSGMCMPSRNTSASIHASWRPPVACCSDWSRTYRYSCCDGHKRRMALFQYARTRVPDSRRRL
jgi:Acyl-CoA dehydrogenase, N-terminal domain